MSVYSGCGAQGELPILAFLPPERYHTQRSISVRCWLHGDTVDT